MGRILTEQRTISGVTRSISYAYNYDGSLASVTYPSGRTITYAPSAAGLPLSAKDIANGVNYALRAAYAPQGSLASVIYGQSGSFGGITFSTTYNNRLMPANVSASSSAGSALNLTYNYFGNLSVSSITNNRDAGRTQSFTYDALNRLSTAYSTATSGADCWGQSIPTDGTGYDRYGNLLKINATQCPSNTPTLSVSVNAFNRLGAGFAYDAPGNMTHDGLYTYTWDDENHLTSGNGWSYFYDGDGKLVKKTTGTLFWKALDGTTLEETDLSGNLVESYIFLGGRRAAQRDAARGNVFYYLPDALGATRTLTMANGTECFDVDYYPFGGEIYFANGCPGQAYQQYRYAGMELHPDIGSKYLTTFRIYTTNQGRWLSPDPLAGDITNPQSLNRYAYVMNNPTNLIDPLGLDGHGTDPCADAKAKGEPCVQQAQPPDIFQASVGQPPSIYIPLTLGAPDNADAYASYANHMNAVFASLYLEAELNNGISDSQISAFLSTHPEINVTFGVLASATVPIFGSQGNMVGWLQANLYGWSIVENPLALAGMMSEATANAALIGTGLEIVGPPLFAEFATSAAGDYLFARGTGLLNSGPVRIGWSWWGNAAWGLAQTYGQEVFRIGIGAYHAFPWYSLWPWQVPGK